MINEETKLEELHFKKGQIICKAGEFEMCMYNILLGSVNVYFDYGTDEEALAEELHEGDFVNVISFLEARPRKSTVVAQETTVVTKITSENFSEFFKTRPAKIMQLLQGMSARMRHLTNDYLRVCEELEKKPEVIERIKVDNSEWFNGHERIYRAIAGMLEREQKTNEKREG